MNFQLCVKHDPLNLTQNGEIIGCTRKLKLDHTDCSVNCENIETVEDTGELSDVNTIGTRKRLSMTSISSEKECFFCGQSNGVLHRASPFKVDKKVRQCTIILEDNVLLSKLSMGDMIAQDSVYHSKCLLTLYRNSSQKQLGEGYTENEKQIHGIVLAELVSFIEQSATNQNTAPVFKVADLAEMYKTRLIELGASPNRVHTTKLQNRIMAHFENIKEFKEGNISYLVFESDIGSVLKTVCDND